ncbi:hypothetical protein [Actinomadura opuntiae]|uniref:hypothetical protein n=1 Tax=Actinomadura sp. OS1-43 TaxID=604315 RepID=UPI00255B1777|nr:hypothetical protein [Actinomadura sp. OS1-43]MDL4815476.1 hypothetical protein [Actinomadura sp. OS1-43]
MISSPLAARVRAALRALRGRTEPAAPALSRLDHQALALAAIDAARNTPDHLTSESAAASVLSHLGPSDLAAVAVELARMWWFVQRVTVLTPSAVDRMTGAFGFALMLQDRADSEAA